MTTGSTRCFRGRWLLLGVSLLAASTSALAQQADVPAVPTAEPEAADTSSPGDIVVTALKRATSLQQTPLAISAVTSESLVAQGITDS